MPDVLRQADTNDRRGTIRRSFSPAVQPELLQKARRSCCDGCMPVPAETAWACAAHTERSKLVSVGKQARHRAAGFGLRWQSGSGDSAFANRQRVSKAAACSTCRRSPDFPILNTRPNRRVKAAAGVRRLRVVSVFRLLSLSLVTSAATH